MKKNKYTIRIHVDFWGKEFVHMESANSENDVIEIIKDAHKAWGIPPLSCKVYENGVLRRVGYKEVGCTELGERNYKLAIYP